MHATLSTMNVSSPLTSTSRSQHTSIVKIKKNKNPLQDSGSSFYEAEKAVCMEKMNLFRCVSKRENIEKLRDRLRWDDKQQKVVSLNQLFFSQ